MIVRRDIRAGDDGLDDGLAVGALACPIGGERLLGFLETEAVGDQWFEVNLARGNEANGELVVTSLNQTIVRKLLRRKEKRHARSSGRNRGPGAP